MVVVVLAAGLALYGCGDSGDDGAAEVAKQEELRAAREEAAQDARQSAKIAELERKLNGERPVGSGGEGDGSPPDGVVPVGTAAPFAGTWRGDAVIDYEDGKSDPFVQTVRIDSLDLGQVSGYSEALQGSTTCHGPLTYEGVSEGWHRFSAEEQNEAECIDYSQVELMPDGSGGLSYREITDVSVSTGTLAPVP